MSSFHLYILFHLTLWVVCVPLESPLAYNMYLFNLRIANHILIKIHLKKKKGASIQEIPLKVEVILFKVMVAQWVKTPVVWSDP